MREETKKRIVAGFFAFLMVASVIGFAASFVGTSQSAKAKYNGYTFYPKQGFWEAKIDGEKRQFLFFPKDLESITLDEGVRQTLQAPGFTVTYNPNSTMASALAEAQYYIETQASNKIITRALTNSTGTKLPEARCTDGTPNRPVIELRESNTSAIRKENNCIIIESQDDYDLAQSVERITYHLLKIIP